MPLLTESDLLLAGYLHTPQLADMLAAVAAMEARGIRDAAYAMKLLRRDFPPPETKLRLRPDPAPLAAAITATCPLDQQNIGAVRRAMEELLRVPNILRGAIMPDACPTGPGFASIPVGGAIAVDNAIIPGAHSEDVCCSMYATFFRTSANIETQLDALMASTRFGPGGRKEEDWIPHPVLQEDIWENPYLQGLERHAAMHLGDQGDGNHFAYLGEATFTPLQIQTIHAAGHHSLAAALTPPDPATESHWKVLVTHHGSRGLGAHVFKRGQKAAEKQTAKTAIGIPLSACWLDASSPEGEAYWEALQYVSRWTRANHQCIHAGFLQKLETTPAAAFGNEHNFVWKRGTTYYHGKGATPAWPDEQGRPQLGLIPLHMSAPILLVLGRDNPDYLSFAPHGAGRNLSRRAATKPYRQDDGTIDPKVLKKLVADQTPGLAVRWWHGKADLSETPMAYKPADQVKAQIQHFDLAEIITEIRPLGCLMAGDGGPRPWARELELTPKQKRQIEHRSTRRKQHQTLTNWDDSDGPEA
jgi:tRNA-splicing ligase RtcB (3'-phosphate/5'-hydroxy nucleic acid ligase)